MWDFAKENAFAIVSKDSNFHQRSFLLLRAFVELHNHAIREKVRIMAEHFHPNVAYRINGRARAMIVTRSRLDAIRRHRALERYLTEQGYDYGASLPSPAPSATATWYRWSLGQNHLNDVYRGLGT